MTRATLLLPLVLSACQPAAADAGRDDDVCARAAAHLAACGAPPRATSGGCDADAADELLGMSCDELAPALRDAKTDRVADAFSTIACASGLVRFCVVPACDAPRYPEVSTVCADYIGIAGCGGCQYYACREAAGHCGASGYYLGFAQKYCERFLLTLRPRMSPAGQRFLDAGRDCLMRYVEDELPPDDACDDVKRRAFASHVACYHDNGFCELPLSDKWLLVNTVDPADVDWMAAVMTQLSCL
jgi:hypothetical protein